MKISHDSLPKAYGYAKLNEQGDKQKGNGSITRDNSGNSRIRDTIDISGAKGTAISAHPNTYRNINDLDSSKIVRFDRLKPDEAANQTENETTVTAQAAAYKSDASTAQASAQTSASGTTATNTKNTVDVGSLNISQIEANLRKELEKDADFIKTNGLDFERVLQGRVYEKVSELTGEDYVNISADSYFNRSTITIGGKALPFLIPDEKNPGSYKAVDRDSDEAKAYVNKLIDNRKNANNEYAKYKELKSASPDSAVNISDASSKNTVDIGSINIAQVEDDTRKELSKDADLLKQNDLDFELVLQGRLYEILSKLTGKDYVNISADSFFRQDVASGNLKLPFHIPDESNPGAYTAVDRDSDEAKAYINQLIEEHGKANEEYAKYKGLKAIAEDAENA